MFEKFDIYFSGELAEGSDPAEVRRALCRMNGIDETKAAKLLSGLPVRIKSNVDVETAGRYRASFRKIGVLIDIRPALAPTTSETAAGMSSPSTATQPVEDNTNSNDASAGDDPAPAVTGISVEEDAELELLPPKTGSLEDCRTAKPATPIPDISAMTVDASGEDLDATPPPEPAQIDTGHLSAEPAGAGSLEDCVVDKPIEPMPDISHLRLLD